MQAAILQEVGTPLVVREIDEPELIPNSVRVRPIYSYVLNFSNAVLGGHAPMKPPTPLVIGCGCVAVVDAVSPDVVGIQEEQIVFVTPWMTSRINSLGVPQDGLIQGWFHLSPTTKTLDRFKNGMWATKAIARAANVYPIHPDLLKGPKALENLAMLNWYCIAYGALERGECLEQGKTVLVLGAAGQLGQCAVGLALALGASKVYAASRSLKKLQGTFRAFCPELSAAAIEDERLVFVAGDRGDAVPPMSCDAVIDFLGFEPTGEPTSQSLGSLRPEGILVLGGGVSGPLTVNYGQMLGLQLNIRGTLMYGPEAPRVIMDLMMSGALRDMMRTYHVYDLSRVNDAVTDAWTDMKRTCLLRMNEPPEL